MNHIQVGKIGEELARQFLVANHFKILFTNYRIHSLELDIVAQKNNILHFIEVKTCKYKTFLPEKDLAILPEEEFSVRKKQKFLKASNLFLLQHPAYEKLQLQVSLIAIYLFDNSPPTIKFYDNILNI